MLSLVVLFYYAEGIVIYVDIDTDIQRIEQSRAEQRTELNRIEQNRIK